MSYYLLIKKMKVRQANALTSHYAITSAPIMAANLFAHAMGIALDIPHSGLAYLHHDGRYLSEHDYRAEFWLMQFQQRRAATYIDKKDYAQGTQSLALQPVANINLSLSLVIEFPTPPDEEVVRTFLTNGRFAGGVIEGFSDIVIFDEFDEAGYLRIPGNGYWLIDRSDCLEGGNPVEKMIERLGTKSSDDDEQNNSWITPIIAGYALISEPKSGMEGVRSLSDGSHPAHAFAEPLLGLAQYVSARSIESQTLPIWRAEWLENTVYVIKNS